MVMLKGIQTMWGGLDVPSRDGKTMIILDGVGQGHDH